MKLKKCILISALILVILVQGTVLNASASIKPIIISHNKSDLSSDQNLVHLTWTIIDDNPNYYQIIQNGSILKNSIKIVSDFISYNFSAIAGIYNITLIIYDYSSDNAESSTIITLFQPAVATSVTSSRTTQNTTVTAIASKVFSTSGTPGYSYLLTLCTISIISITYIIKRSKSKRR